jgi:hypothetical protein
MYIVAIGWLYVTSLMALTEPNFVGGVLTFLCYGLLPCALLLWLTGAPQRKRNRLAKATEQPLGKPDGANTKADEHDLL